MITRLRPLPSPDELAAMYPEPHDHHIYGRGHAERVQATIDLALLHIPAEIMRMTVADLSCGNGTIARAITTDRVILGDYAPGYDICGPIEETLVEIPVVDVFVLSETLEHLDDPVTVLAGIRRKAGALVLSTPLECWEDSNPEHLFAWDREGVETMLAETGWTPIAFDSVDSREYFEPYLYGLWVCS